MLIIFYINYSTTNVIVVFEAEVGAVVDFLIVYVVQLSPLTTVAQFVAFVLIVDKSEIVSCFPSTAVFTAFCDG